MELLHRRLLSATFCALVLSLPLGAFAQTSQQGNAAAPSHIVEPDIVLQSTAELPDSPGTEWAKAQNAPMQTPNSAPQTSSSSSQQGDSSNRQPDTPVQDQKLQRPVGTAAAEAPKVSGITAAEPAGVAIAPAKQRRVRTIVIKVGAIVAAGVAVGAVIALSEGTSSKPPGAH